VYHFGKTNYFVLFQHTRTADLKFINLVRNMSLWNISIRNMSMWSGLHRRVCCGCPCNFLDIIRTIIFISFCLHCYIFIVDHYFCLIFLSFDHSWLNIKYNLPVQSLPFPEKPISHWQVAEPLILLQWLQGPQGRSGHPSLTERKNKYTSLLDQGFLLKKYFLNVPNKTRQKLYVSRVFVLVPLIDTRGQ
jgi:hypothetical protein